MLPAHDDDRHHRLGPQRREEELLLDVDVTPEGRHGGAQRRRRGDRVGEPRHERLDGVVDLMVLAFQRLVDGLGHGRPPPVGRVPFETRVLIIHITLRENLSESRPTGCEPVLRASAHL